GVRRLRAGVQDRQRHGRDLSPYNPAMRVSRPLLAILLFIAPRVANGQAPAAEKPQRYARLLARECDALIDAAVKRPYGWGWSEANPRAPAKPGRRPHVI